MYTLKKDGDSFEKVYWNGRIKDNFPAYEKYWSKYVTPLTNRPINIHAKSSQELTQLGHTPEEVCLSQLHYTIFKHLIRSIDILENIRKQTDLLFTQDLLSEGLFHLTASQDIAFEFLQRISTPGIFDPWVASKILSPNKQQNGSKEAREKWQKNNNRPLQRIRNYRNHLTHGRMSPYLFINNKILVPKIGEENKYLDWRMITDWNQNMANLSDFDIIDNILDLAITETINYFEIEWNRTIHL